jgi:putative ABC transport system substrate-binding protein
MQRRKFLTLLGGAAATWPVAARAQQPAMPVIGFLGQETPERFADRLQAFHQGLNDTGYVEGRNVAIEYRWADGQIDRLPAMITELVRRQVAVIVSASGTQTAIAAKAATQIIPIVFLNGSNPVEIGLVASLSHPGRNVTGITQLNAEIGPKRLELLHELLPSATTLALLVNPTNPVAADNSSRDLQAAANILGVQLRVFQAGTERDFDTIFAALDRSRVGGLVIDTDAFFTARSDKLAALTIQYSLPTVFGYFPSFVNAGGLMAYGAPVLEASRILGNYTGRILKGEKPSELPVQQATKIRLMINLKTAKALGLAVPTALLVRADEVIE